MNRTVTSLLLALLLSTLSVASADNGTRLLPESFAKTVGFSWRQDGRVIEIQIANPKDKWFLQHLAIQAQFAVSRPIVSTPMTSAATKKPVPASSPGPSLSEFLDYLPESHAVSVEIQPGKNSSAHLELTSNRKVTELTLVEVRGREQSGLERLKSSLW